MLLFLVSIQQYLDSGDWDDVEELPEKLQSYKGVASSLYSKAEEPHDEAYSLSCGQPVLMSSVSH